MAIFTEAMLNFLPEKARSKAIRLDEDFDAAGAAVKAAQSDLEDAWLRRDLAERNAQTSGKHTRTGTVRHPLERLRKLLAEGDAEIDPAFAKIEIEIAERLQPRLDRANAVFQAQGVVQSCGYWIADAMRAGVKLRDAAPVKLTAKDHRREVEEARNELSDLTDQLYRVESAPQPLSVIREAIAREIDEIADRGRPRLSFTAREVSPLRLDRALGIVNSERGPRIAETIIWLLRDEAVAKAVTLIGSVEPEGAMSDTERDAALERLAAEILAAGRREEAAIEAAAEVGMVIFRRSDADPRAVLGIEELTPGWRSRHDVGLDDMARV
ncbi:hypothetical protein [Agrobacterium deltaense]|uniref:hypothetical protein n=1 Tax=Agrobacterium deltaense TaxID=1183412 RepID=UPI0009B9DF5E|nr:hypothetical protein [Agrobacterium deltaense]CUX08637.1 hypothetical protein AGR7B_Cc10173 [Agrobacterium deltaense RV3]